MSLKKNLLLDDAQRFRGISLPFGQLTLLVQLNFWETCLEIVAFRSISFSTEQTLRLYNGAMAASKKNLTSHNFTERSYKAAVNVSRAFIVFMQTSISSLWWFQSRRSSISGMLRHKRCSRIWTYRSGISYTDDHYVSLPFTGASSVCFRSLALRMG